MRERCRGDRLSPPITSSLSTSAADVPTKGPVLLAVEQAPPSPRVSPGQTDKSDSWATEIFFSARSTCFAVSKVSAPPRSLSTACASCFARDTEDSCAWRTGEGSATLRHPEWQDASYERARSWCLHAWKVSSARRRIYCARRGSAGGISLAKPPPRFRLGTWQFRLNAWTLRGRLGACDQVSTSQAQT
jgi:hypothetical protein